MTLQSSGLPSQTNIVTKNLGVVKLNSVIDKLAINHFGIEIEFGSPLLLKTVRLTLSSGDTITLSENYPVPTVNGDSILSQNCFGIKLLTYDSLHDGVEVIKVDYTGQTEYCHPPVGFSPLLVTPDNSNSIMGLVIYV